ncbi:carboxy terminal-processing peptidase [Flavobacterium capsici]|uniref:Carboxy terminal-processing peptidase n=1 Tax=Flavobacterium capsici TaxID=3075618 RepID=A0AA96JAA0_9FLAO|nr:MULTISPECIES: carboxy terminal-processing peptidase [unclassified Flavobacterium]WNM19985.1 carboxy terminal-processing peptidase [Flavobacterium sp. PMR2A8]WNM21374.1 carboxy terminal-processing peptidase [Flavobacterium sp. PMTSA4]
MKPIFQFMKRNYKFLLAVLALSVALWSFIPKEKASDPEKDKLLIELLTFVIEKGHYNPAAIDDTFSKGVYKDYLEALDPSKRFFLQSDIDEFSKYETLIDDQINNKELTFFDLTYTRLIQRMNESKSYYEDALSSPIDYKKDESISTDYEKIPYAKNQKELKDRWRKQVKLSTLSSLVEKQKVEEEKAKSKDNKEAPKTFEQLEKETRESTLKSLNDNFGFIKDLNRDDWFSVYINAISSRFDPHTSYFAPNEKERFDVSMSGKLEGIGARLQKENDFTKITELISGGPAWRGKQLEAGDLVLKVAQASGEPVDVVGMRLDDVVKKIKGPKGTEVKLTVKKPDGSIKVISIIRDEVEIEETYVKSSVVEIDGNKYGIIYLPKFYIDFENKDSRDAGKDVAKEVERLKEQNVQGIVMDVRDNGGGSLKTVVDIAGLFIEQGPIVQIKSAAGKKEVLYDRDSKVQWDGPLVVMINEFSASASEILAAAIQDYKRGVIVGSKQSYGKGTVQNVIDLNQFVRGSTYGDLGALKTTTQKFYRINGGSTQREGVKSDVVMPDKYEFLKMGEKDVDNAMPWDKIDAADYKVWDKQNNFDLAIAQSKARLENNPQMQLIEDNAKWLDERNKDNVYSLQIDKFKAEQKALEEKNKKYKPITEYKNRLEFTSLPYENEMVKDDPVLKEKRDRWHESLSKDVYIDEALHILNDMQNGSEKKGLTNKVKTEKIVKS